MKPLEFLKGKKIMVTTDVGVIVEMEIKEVKENKNSRDLTPATRENDWWPETVEWSSFTVFFTNGHSKEYDSLDKIDVH